MRFKRAESVVQPACVLCGSRDTASTETIAADAIVGLYARKLRPRVKRELHGAARIEARSCGNCGLCFFLPSLPGSQAYYESLQSYDWYYLKDKAEYAMAARVIPPGARVLEIGCGAGWFAKHLPGCEYTGLEYSEAAAAMARANRLNVFAQSVYDHALGHAGAYGVVCSFQVLEHVPDPRAFLTACIECLEPGGLLIQALPSNEGYLRFLANAYLNLPPHHLTRWPDRTLQAIAGIFPLSLVALEHEPLAPIHRRLALGARLHRRADDLLGREPAFVDRSLLGRIVTRGSELAAAGISAVRADREPDSQGHTVLAVYRKLPGGAQAAA